MSRLHRNSEFPLELFYLNSPDVCFSEPFSCLQRRAAAKLPVPRQLVSDPNYKKGTDINK